MAALLPYARLLALAVFTSFALTSCFDHDKKCDPRPSSCTKNKPTGSTGSN